MGWIAWNCIGILDYYIIWGTYDIYWFIIGVKVLNCYYFYCWIITNIIITVWTKKIIK